ncbi:helix-turn-helix domain-containing protein [Sphingosinicella terrae]|uniref:helix-turn-helix domain-containing protein n=1 Tax=Sphingosinicella terrae TaxID=2172047 RepID=UPI000E0DF629|nr:AraC family transcriptional regulator [Sphingosinicella terrae]
MEHRFRDRLEKFAGVEKPPTLTISAFEAGEFTATRLQWKESASHRTQFDRVDGYLICLQRRELPAHPYWVEERALSLAARPGQFLLLDLNVRHGSLGPSEVDCISVHISRETLRRYEQEHGISGGGQLITPLAEALDDDVIRNLTESLLPAIHQPETPSQLYSSHVALALLARLTSVHGAAGTNSPRPSGRLAPWQVRRAKELLIAHLDGDIGLETLASECRLSRSHFARAFKATTGSSPLRWQLAQRLERAKTLLLDTDLPVDEIANACGFADASHLSRHHVAATGMPPGAWRRAHRS